MTSTPWPWPKPAGAASARGGCLTLVTERQRKWKGRSAAEVCTSAARKIGVPLVTRQGRSPSGRSGYLALRVARTNCFEGGRCGWERPAGGGDGRRRLLPTAGRGIHPSSSRIAETRSEAHRRTHHDKAHRFAASSSDLAVQWLRRGMIVANGFSPHVPGRLRIFMSALSQLEPAGPRTASDVSLERNLAARYRPSV